MKNLFMSLLATGFMTLCFSCQDFLEKPLSSDITVDSVFASKVRTEQFLWKVYNTCSIYEFPYYWDGSDYRFQHYGSYGALVSAATDELQCEASWPYIVRFVNTGTWNASNVHYCEFNSKYAYAGIRNANIFLENIDRAPFEEQERQEMKAEARFLRALMYFDLWQRLGGVSIVTEAISAGAITDLSKLKIPRSTYEKTVDFIVEECDQAARHLPNGYESRYLGRIVKGAALALKARTLLYAASPLFNSEETYVPVSDPELREMIGYPNYDASRWERAAEANKAVLEWAENESGWCSLYKGMDNPADRYEEIFVNSTVPEIILDAGLMGTSTSGYFCRFLLPGQIMGAHDIPVNHAVTFNFTKLYQRSDGTEQVWDEVEGESYPYEQYQIKLGELDPRFQASAFVSGTEWSKGTGTVYHFFEDNNLYLKNVPGVGFLRKFCKGVKNGSTPAPRWITFRLAEFYLNYAEALNEKPNISAADKSEVEWALHQVRDRVNMSDITYEQYPDRASMREAIHRERAVELAFEQHRYFDVRRWKTAVSDGALKGDIYTLQLSAGPDKNKPTVGATYQLKKVSSRVWEDKMYLYPFQEAEVNLGYLKQNPGWE